LDNKRESYSTMLRAKERRRDASDLCVYQLVFVVAPSIEWYATLKNNR